MVFQRILVASLVLQCSAAVLTGVVDDECSLLQVSHKVESRVQPSATSQQLPNTPATDLEHLVSSTVDAASEAVNLASGADVKKQETAEESAAITQAMPKAQQQLQEAQHQRDMNYGATRQEHFGAVFKEAKQVKAMEAPTEHAWDVNGGCLDAQQWHSQFTSHGHTKRYSQGDQDAVLYSLFSTANLGTTNKQFVEFGYPDKSLETSYGNGHALRENLGFEPVLLLDGAYENKSINLHKRWITADDIVSLFNEFKVPYSPDYVSVDIDSCDLWVFYSLTDVYRPRVVTTEYNSGYPVGDYSTLRCDNPKDPKAYRWHSDDAYGASFSALELAARHRGYSLVYTSPMLDMFFVPEELICPGTAVPLATHASKTGLALWSAYNGGQGPREQIVMNFSQWLHGGE
jgi:hypothetical protein